jgi:hypothetical protein
MGTLAHGAFGSDDSSVFPEPLGSSVRHCDLHFEIEGGGVGASRGDDGSVLDDLRSIFIAMDAGTGYSAIGL